MAKPKWLERLEKMTDEQLKAQGWTRDEVKEAESEVMLQADYTQKTQEIAPLRELVAKHGDKVDWGKAAEWYGWGAEEWPKFKQQYEQREQELANARAELAKREAAGNGGGASNNGGGTRRSRKWNTQIEDVFSNTARLTELADEVYDVATREVTEALPGHFDKWWQEKTGPVVTDTANRYMLTATEMMRPLYDAQLKDTGLTFDDILKAAAAAGSRDFNKILESEKKRIEDTKRKGFDEGHARGIEEAKGTTTPGGGNGAQPTKPAVEPSGPAGSGTPFWKPAPDQPRGKTTFESVINKVQEKRGVKLPL